jgi:transcriptional regulator with XRE-family HTH domain
VPAKTCKRISLKLVTLVAMDSEWLTRFKEALAADGRSPRALSLDAGLGPNYVSEMLHKGKEPGVDKLLRLCAEMKVSATYILTGSEVSPQSEEMLGLLADMRPEHLTTLLDLARQLKAVSR